MIPITVSFFLKQSETRKNRALSLALVYSLTIVLVLAVGGLVLMRVLINVSQHWATNFVLAGIFLFFALSLLGMYDITLPSWLTTATSSQEGRGGLVGTFFMALTFSIISFTCVGPIYGGFIAFEASGQASAANSLQQVLSVLGFSVAFASPFFVLALFPGLLRSLPRSGSWMNSVKVVMGFLELAAVFKFLRSAEVYLVGKADWFTFDLVLGTWVALAVACGLYLLNVFRLPHDHDVPETIGVPRLLFSLIFLGLGLYMLPGLFKTAQGAPQKPGGQLFNQIQSFLLPESSGGGNLPEALARARREKKLVFIDFTGVG
jgi:thiol:disulfide interchange protein DsbD